MSNPPLLSSLAYHIPNSSISQVFLFLTILHTINWPWWGNTLSFLAQKKKLASFHLKKERKHQEASTGNEATFHAELSGKKKSLCYYINLNTPHPPSIKSISFQLQLQYSWVFLIGTLLPASNIIRKRWDQKPWV